MAKKRVLTEAEKERARIRSRAWYAANKERAKASNDCNVRKNDRTDDEYFVYLSEARAVLDDVMWELLAR